MRKVFLGARLRTLREQRGQTQAALAAALGLSGSYLNQIENNQRPLTAAVLLKLQSALGADLQMFSEDDEARLIAQLQEAVADTGAQARTSYSELQTLVQQMPALARRVIDLHRQARDGRERLEVLASGLGDREIIGNAALAQPHAEVSDFFYSRHNHIAELDELAEGIHAQLQSASGLVGDLALPLELRLRERYGVTTRAAAGQSELRSFDPVSRVLSLDPELEPAQRSFQLAVQLAYLEAGELITTLAAAAEFRNPESRALSRIGLASYFAGALILPYGPFLAAAEAMGYDVDLVARRFGVSVETTCHRLSTLQRPQAPGVPFFFIRIDRAGNISKRQSATDFHFSRTGGTCPLWNVYEAFSQPDKVLTQLAQMPDGRTYLWIARCVTHHGRGYGPPSRRFALALGCDVRHASRLVYARGLALDDPKAATPIGPGCKVCERKDCLQRAYPALGLPLRIEENRRVREPYASA